MAHTYVPPEGDKHSAIIALVGEQPGKREVRTGRPFVGPAGRELDACLVKAGIVRRQCYLTNVIKDLDAPLANYVDISRKNPVVSSQGKYYIEALRDELAHSSANVIVPIGNVALFALTNRVGITKWRGSILESTLLPGRKVVPTVHPATILPPKNVYLNKRLIIFDLMKAKVQSGSPKIIRMVRNARIRPSFYETREFLQRCKDALFVGFDIEVVNEQVSCISFSMSPHEALCIPFVDGQGDYFTIDQEATIWKDIAEILENPNIIKMNQNILFDVSFLLRRYGIKTVNMEDTMIAQKTLYPEYPVALEFITTAYTDIPYYKADGKRWFKVGGPMEQLWTYNDMDTLACQDAFPKQVGDLKRQENFETYKRQVRTLGPLMYMMERGIKVDTKGMKKAGQEMLEKVQADTERLHSLIGYEINPDSPKQLANYFYIEKGIKPYTIDGVMTTNDDAMKRLARQGIEEARLVREIRSTSKLLGTYLGISKTDRDTSKAENVKVDSDGRIRCSYNPAGTRFSRLSSSENIFGTGTNLQNWPTEMLRYLIADDGYVIYILDLSQAENRIVAYVGRVKTMIEAFESGRDVHRLTASLVFGKPYDEISNEPESSSIGSGRFSERFWGKKTNHESNYGIGYRKFSLICEISEKEGKWILERYHLMYPEVEQVYQAYVKAELSKNRTITNLMGRRTLFLDKWGIELFKDAYSCIPQGTVGDVVNERGLIYTYENDSFSEVELLNQVHDSIGIQIPLSAPWEYHANVLIDIKRSLETPLVFREREFVIPVDITMGLNMNKEEGFTIKHDKFPTDLAKTLWKAYGEMSEECQSDY